MSGALCHCAKHGGNELEASLDKSFLVIQSLNDRSQVNEVAFSVYRSPVTFDIVDSKLEVWRNQSGLDVGKINADDPCRWISITDYNK